MIHAVVNSQYHAALDMLAQVIDPCPADIWTADVPNPFWQTAYHALFYTHLYLQPTEADFTPWAGTRGEAHFFSAPPWSADGTLDIRAPYTQAELKVYVAFLHTEIDRVVPLLDFSAASGFNWLPFNKLELQFYSIRHLQQHTGELSMRLFAKGILIRWVGQQPG